VRMENSERLRDRALLVDGILAARGPVFSPPEGPAWEYATFVDHAQGPYIWDVNGERKLDLTLAFGAVVLGHADARVDEAVCAAIRKGVSPTLHSPLQVTLAERLVEMVPGDDLQCAFMRTGSDATSAAVRIARAATGRNHVIHCGYNGWHDWSAPELRGVPSAVQQLTSSVQYDNLDQLAASIEEHKSDLACFVLVPFETDLPHSDYLARAAQLTRAAGAIFVLDEIRTGFRLALGGAQQYFNVVADLVTYSKAIANGYSISAVVGSRDLMRTLADISLSSLFFRSTDGIAAALSTLAVLRDTDALARLWRLGTRLQSGLAQVARQEHVPVKVVGLPPMPFHVFGYQDPSLTEGASEVFSRETWRQGVIFHPRHHWFVCATMTESDIDNAIAAAQYGYRIVAQRFGRD
jgi:glutamate-1-semialdehyde aminotransferase